MKKKLFDHITPILTELHWLPVRKRIQFKVLLLTFKALHDQSPGYLSSLIEERKLRPGLRTSVLTLRVPSTRLKTYGDRAFFGRCSKTLELPSRHPSQDRWPWKYLKQTLKYTFSGKCEINNDHLRSRAPLNVISQINGAEEMLWIIIII